MQRRSLVRGHVCVRGVWYHGGSQRRPCRRPRRSAVTTQRSAVREARTTQVYYNITTLLRAAAWHWRASGMSLSLGALARGIGVWPITVGDMAANRTKQINMTTMGLVAWYFGVTTIDDLIRYDPRAPARQESD